MTTPPPKPIKPASNPAAVPENMPKRTNQKELIGLCPTNWKTGSTDRAIVTNQRRSLLSRADRQGGIYAKILGVPLPAPVFPRRCLDHSIELCLRAQVRFDGSVVVLKDEALRQASARGPATSTRH